MVKIMQQTAASPRGELRKVTAMLWASVCSSIKWELKIVQTSEGFLRIKEHKVLAQHQAGSKHQSIIIMSLRIYLLNCKP